MSVFGSGLVLCVRGHVCKLYLQKKRRAWQTDLSVFVVLEWGMDEKQEHYRKAITALVYAY